MSDLNADYFYWISADDGRALGRSDSETYARRMAERYSRDTPRFKACDMILATTPDASEGSVIDRFQAKPGERSDH